MLAVPVDWFLGEEVITINPASILMTGGPCYGQGQGPPDTYAESPWQLSYRLTR